LVRPSLCLVGSEAGEPGDKGAALRIPADAYFLRFLSNLCSFRAVSIAPSWAYYKLDGKLSQLVLIVLASQEATLSQCPVGPLRI